MSSDLLDAFYERLRRQVEHEDSLYNQRIVWLITMQAFLYATVGLVLQATSDLTRAQFDPRIDGFTLLICMIGFLVALISGRILANAREALAHLASLWEAQVGKAGLSEEALAHYPPVAGGAGKTRRRYVLRSGQLPSLFAASWIAIAALMLVGKTLA